MFVMRQRVIIILELLAASGILVSGALKILPFGGIPVLVVLGLVSVWLRRAGQSGIVQGERPGLKLVLLSSAFGVAYQAVCLWVLDPLVIELTGVRQDLSIFAGIRGNVRLLTLDLGLVWTLAAFGEEFVFRGYLLNRIAQLWDGPRAALSMGVVLSSALWSISHFYQGIAGVILVTLHGFVFGVLYLLVRRNLWFTIFAHGVYDTTALLLIFFGSYPN